MASAPRSPRAWPGRARPSPPAYAGNDVQGGGVRRSLPRQASRRRRQGHAAPGQCRLGRRLPPSGGRGHRAARTARHSRQQRGHHDRQDGRQDDRRGLEQGPVRQLVRRLLPLPGRADAHARAGHGPHHQCLVRHRGDRQHRPGELRGVEVGTLRPDEDPGQRGTVPARPIGKAQRGSIGVTVNTVTPGFVATEMLDAVPEKVLEKIKARFRWAVSRSRRKSHELFTSLPPTPPGTSPARCGG